MSWFEENRDALQTEFPDAQPAELTKHGMRRFKTLGTENGNASPSSNKRKLSAEEGRHSGVSKLAKFGFTKN